MNELTLINENATVAESTKVLREMFSRFTTKRQLDLIIAIASLVNENDTRFTTYQIPFREFGKVLNPSNPDTEIIHADIKKAIIGIFESCFCISTENTDTFYHWVETARIDKEQKIVSFRLNDEVQKFYLQLQEGKTLYVLKDLLSLSSMFQACVFRWLSANKGFSNAVPILVDKAKQQFNNNVPISTKKFIEKLNRSLKKINEKTNLYVSYKKIYEGKKLVKLEFSILDRFNQKKIEV